jgi:hypothetical protein
MSRISLILIAIWVAGCGTSRTSPVTGLVLLDGKPVADATVQFVPQGKGRDATSQTDKDGEFAMSTFKPRDGMLPGEYKVVIMPPTGPLDTTQYTTADAAMSGAAAKPSPKKEPGFPQKYARADQTPLTQTVPVSGKLKFDLQSKQ